jgi:DNA-binding MarR family transcriptional regulator/GNAT superfamily N-acetyltransferase
MELAAIAQVRRFNRAVTQRIGVLNDEYLARGRPLGASRVLWEIGVDGSDARTLRSSLDLDSGYLSRLLRSLQREGLVSVEPDVGDKRVRRVQLTRAGRSECDVLDRRSDALAESMLAPLNATQRDRLVDAMSVVERLLTAGMVEVTIEDPTSTGARFCIASYFAELDARFDTGFDPSRSIPADDLELVEPAGLLLVARLHGEPIGCGALKLHDTRPAEIKRMWVASSARGLGVGRRILRELEQHAGRLGASALRLETNETLSEAINLYRSAGFAEVAPFNEEPYAHHWFEKQIDRSLD